MPPPPLRPALERFGAILHALGWAVAKQTGWGLSLQLIAVIVRRIQRIQHRFARLAARIAAGTYAPRPAAAARAEHCGDPPKPPPPDPLPNNPGWLLPLESSAVAHRAALEALFLDAEMVALMAAAPAAMARVLRPLCRMLALDLPPALARPRPSPADPRPDRPPRTKPAAPPRQKRPASSPPLAAPGPLPALTLEYGFDGPRLVWN